MLLGPPPASPHDRPHDRPHDVHVAAGFHGDLPIWSNMAFPARLAEVIVSVTFLIDML